ncbi:MAG: ImmA/IrrE family metallo-endopeptidase [Peptostreptococcaceae bacterium]
MVLEHIREKVRIIKKYYPGLSAFNILQELKVVTSFLDVNHLIGLTGADKVEGCYYKSEGVKFVLINPLLCEHERNRLYAHELGHVLFHPEINTFELELYDKVFVEKLELEANTFCSEFLLDDDVFTRCSYESKEDIAKAFGLPLELVELKYNNLLKLNLIETPSFSVI